MSFFNLSTGEQAQSVKSVDVETKAKPIPDNTLLRVMITEAKWKDASEYAERHISLRWDVLDGEFKKRVVFQKVRVAENDANKRDKAIKMLAAIDANAGGKLMAAGTEPSDMDLMMNLCNKPMQIKVKEWRIKEERDGTPIPEADQPCGNWVVAVSDGKAQAAPVSEVGSVQTTVTTEQAAAQDKANDNALGF